ncbi:MAG: AbrB/MazE/SpoVT family DNA-binding domain-containing protein [Fluviicoccus sp.]|uniref:antitoxin n=1 Tax=Fluviicoccus sp. TaxID=2003552 RepID=UPI0027218FA7|nr:AbrB/MazE/SpoVT family DNA-binding domain-containing protein [Fluviicoccus sp.]MDO8328898.1 AbrB/MazE/SpoVT family DNA-binding domain-containing protein [Fluviicoccus sp.]
MNLERHARLFRNGRNQAIRIPREFEFVEDEVLIRKEGNTLVIVPVQKSSLLAMLAGMEPLDVDFPDVDEGLLPVDEANLPL